MNLFHFEGKKIFNLKSLLIFILLCILPLGYYLFSYGQMNNLMHSRLPVHPKHIQYANPPENQEEEAERVTEYNQQLDIYELTHRKEDNQWDKKDKQLLEKSLNATTLSRSEIEMSNMPISIMELHHSHTVLPLMTGEQSYGFTIAEATRYANRDQFEFLLNHQIEPRLPLLMQLSAIDWQTMKEENEKTTREFQKRNEYLFSDISSHYDKAWYRLWHHIQRKDFLIVIAISLFIFGTLLVKEFSNHHCHLSFLLTESISKQRIFITKYLLSICSGLAFLTIPSIGLWILASYSSGSGNLNYPVLYHLYADDFQLPQSMGQFEVHPFEGGKVGLSSISLEIYLLQATILLVLILLFMMSICYLLSVFVRNELIVGILGIAVLFSHPIFPSISYLPMTYFDIDAVITGSANALLRTSAITFENGAIVLLIWTFMNISLGYLLFTNRPSLYRMKVKS